MGNREKRLQRIRQNPKQVSYNDLVLVLLDNGFVERNTKNGGSHRVFTRGVNIITVPCRRPHVLQVYVKREGQVRSLQLSVGSSGTSLPGPASGCSRGT